MFPELESTPFLIIRRDGKASLSGAEIDLRDVGELALVYDLGAAAERFGQVAGGREEFGSRDVLFIAGICPQTMRRWLESGILTCRRSSTGRGDSTGFVFDRADAFLAGVAGALRRQGLPLPALEAAVKLLSATLRPAEVEAV